MGENASYEVPSGQTTFKIAGTDKEVTLKVRKTLKDLGALWDAIDNLAYGEEPGAAPPELTPAQKHDRFLDAVIDYVRMNAGVELDQDEADGLNDALAIVQAEVKKKAVARLKSAQSMAD